MPRDDVETMFEELADDELLARVMRRMLGSRIPADPERCRVRQGVARVVASVKVNEAEAAAIDRAMLQH